MGTNSLAAVSHYLDGYAHASADHELLEGWRIWVELRFGICHPAWHWTRILLHAYGSDGPALAALPQLYDEFVAERQRDGLESIVERWESKFGGLDDVVEPK